MHVGCCQRKLHWGATCGWWSTITGIFSKVQNCTLLLGENIRIVLVDLHPVSKSGASRRM